MEQKRVNYRDGPYWPGKLRFGAETMTIGSAILTQFSNVTERRTDGEIDGQTGVPTMVKAALWRTVALRCLRSNTNRFGWRETRASTGGKWTQLASKLGSGGIELHLEGEEFIQFLFTKSETLDGCRFETKMHQNAPNPISISIFSRTPATGGCAQYPRGGRGCEGREGKGWKGEGKGRGWGSLRHCRWCDRRPWREIE